MSSHDRAVPAPDNVPLRSSDGAYSELLVVRPATAVRHAVYWVPAMGVPARHYLDFAGTLAERGILVVLHEWRGLGSSDRRASRVSDWGYRELLTLDIEAGLTSAKTLARAPDVDWTLAGHSLGGQLAVLYAALQPGAASRLLLVASGAPWWRAFPMPWNIGLRMAFAVAPMLGAVCGYFPGRRVGFGGREARGVMHDWAMSGRTGNYAIRGLDVDVEAAMERLNLPVLALRMQKDPFGPAGSLRWLLHKMTAAPSETHELSALELGCRADHFAWIKHADAVAAHTVDWLQRSQVDCRPQLLAAADQRLFSGAPEGLQ